MEFKNFIHEEREFKKIKIEEEWYVLCACKNCKRVHAIPNLKYITLIDEKIKCCDEPENWCTYYNTDKIIEKFIKEWEE